MEIVIESTRLRLTVEPGMGGKITGLQDRESGREWLWRNPHLAQQTPTYGQSYIKGLDTGGWDEIFPSVSPCRIDGLMIPDHGDLVSLPWEVVDVTPSSVEMAVTTRFAPCRFTRTLHLGWDAMRVDYCLENTGGDALPYLWCAHPLIAIEPGMSLKLPDGTLMSVDRGTVEAVGRIFVWPHLAGRPPLDQIPDPATGGFQPFAAKIFSEAGDVNEVTITTADHRHFLRLAWKAEDAPYLGIWLNYAAWSGCGSTPYFNLGLEPGTAPFDSLQDAIAAADERRIAPGECRRWSLHVSVGTTA